MIEDHLEKLKYFHEIAKQGSFSRASAVLYITQPSLTKSVKVLEESIGKKLFVRTPKGVLLTDEGSILFNYTIEMFSKVEEVETLLVSNKNAMSGTIHIGTYDSVSVYFWPHFIKYIYKIYPKLKIRLTTDRSVKILNELENGSFDLALTIDPKISRYLKQEVIAYDHFDYYTCVNKSERMFSSFENASIIYMEESISSSDFMDNINNDNKAYKVSNLESAKALALNGIGVAILPNFVAKDEVKRKGLVRIKSKAFPSLDTTKHPLTVSYAKDREKSVIIQNVVTEMISYSNKYL
jgi:DNA-binding transcriptional LysR family regulator